MAYIDKPSIERECNVEENKTCANLIIYSFNVSSTSIEKYTQITDFLAILHRFLFVLIEVSLGITRVVNYLRILARSSRKD